MTYEESYMEYETIEDLEKEIAKDAQLAIITNPDRLKHIKEAGEKVANLKFGVKIETL